VIADAAHLTLSRGEGPLSDIRFSIVDDCSSDGTAVILKSFGASINLTILPQNRGAYGSRNHGASLAKGEYLVFLDGDDVLMPWALNLYDHLITARCPQIILGQAVRFHGKVPVTNSGELSNSTQFVEYPHFLAKDRPGLYNSSALVINRSYFWSLGGWSNGIFYQDIQDLLAKLGTSGKTIFVLKPGTVWYRMHSKNAVLNVPSFVEGIRVLLENAKSGKYPGGRKHRIERSAWFGGVALYWAKEAIRTRHFAYGFNLIALSWRIILLALIRRSTALLLGRKPSEELPLQYD
jgi:glycosyltransferase involved in cell wall biosynthesis